LEQRRQVLANEVSQVEKRLEPLREDVIQKEQREAELSQRVEELERRAQLADERLAAARKELRTLASLGLSQEGLAGFVQRLDTVSQKHRIKAGTLRGRLLHELEQLEVGLGLESLVEARRHDIAQIEQAIAERQQERAALDSALKQLSQRQATRQAAIADEEAHVRKEMHAIAKIARDAVVKLGQDLGTGVDAALLEAQRLRDQAFALGQEVGRADAIVEANQWLRTMVALVKGDSGITAGDVRVVTLAVLRGLKSWTQQNQSQVSRPYSLTTQLDSTIEELERWKT
jgi:chromosome segregation ATPase